MPEDNKNSKIEDHDIKLREVRTVQGPVEAEVIKSFLESNGIQCIMRGLVVQSIHAFSADGLGKIKIMVAEDDYATAKQLFETLPKE